MIKFSLLILMFSFGNFASAAKKFDFTFKEQSILDVIEEYSKVSERTIVVDPSIKGRISIFAPKKVSEEEAFNLLSQSLARNSYAFSVQGKSLVVMPARDIQRNQIPVVTQLPDIQPERMLVYIFKLKHVNAKDVMSNLRILPSKDGEMSSDGSENLVFVDWASNLQRVDAILKEVDKPAK